MDKPAENSSQRKTTKLGAWGFSRHERRAIWLLTTLLLVGSGFRFWNQRETARQLTLLPPAPDSALGLMKSSDLDLSPLNLNLVTASDLEQLPGIGPKRALDIVTFRERNGRFDRVEDIDRVPGIGPATVDRLRPYLFVAPDSLR